MKKVSLCRMVSSVALSIGAVNVYLYASDIDSMRVDAQDETLMGPAVKTPVHESLGRVNNNQKTWTIGGKIGLGGSIALLALGGLCLCFIATPIGCVMSILMIAFGVILMPVSFKFGRRDIPVNNAALLVAPESVPLHHDAGGAAPREPSPDVSNSRATLSIMERSYESASTRDAADTHATMPEHLASEAPDEQDHEKHAEHNSSYSTPKEMEVYNLSAHKMDSTEQLSDDIDVSPLANNNALLSLLDEETPPVSWKPSPKTSVEQPQSNPAPAPDARSAWIDGGMNKLLEYVNADQLPEKRDIKALLAAAEKAHSLREYIYTALCIAAVRIGDEDMLRSLSVHNASIAYDKNAKTALMWLAEKQPHLLLKILKELQGERQWVNSNDVVIEDEMFKAKLQSSGFKLYADSNLSYLMEKAHDKVDDNGMNALMYAVKSGNLDLVKLLLAASMYEYWSSCGYSDVRKSPFLTKDCFSRTVFAYATDKDVFQFLYEAMNNSVKNMQAQCDEYPKALEALKVKKELEAKGEGYNFSCCQEASEYKQAIEVSDNLVQNFEEVLPYQKDRDGHTLMIYAARSRNRDIVKTLKQLTIAQLKKAVAVELKDAFKSAIVELFKYDEVAQCKEAILQRFKDKIGTTLENAIVSSLQNQCQDERFTQFKDVMVARLKDAMSATLHDTILESLKCAVSSSLIKEDAEIASLKDTIVESLRSDKALQLTDEMLKHLKSAIYSLLGDIKVATLEKAIVDSLPNVISELLEDAIANSFSKITFKELCARMDSLSSLATTMVETLKEKREKTLEEAIVSTLEAQKAALLEKIVNALRSNEQVTSLMACLYTDLMLACMSGDVDSARRLLSEAQKVDQKGRTALMYAAMFGQGACVKLLLENTEEAKLQDKGSMTALMHAAAHGHQDCVQLLLEHECGFKDYGDNKALWYALRNGHLECVDLLFNKEKDQTQLSSIFLQAIFSGNVQIVDKILKKEYIVKGVLGDDPVKACLLLGRFIQQVMAKGYYDVAVSLWQCMQEYKTALENITDETKDAKMAIRLSSMTPLMYAAQVGNEACISRFIAQVRQKDAEGKTALMYAVISVDINIVIKSIKWLLEAEAGIQDNDGKTALMYYVRKYSYDPGKVIEDYPAQVYSVLEVFVHSKDVGKTAKDKASALSLLASKLSLNDNNDVAGNVLAMLKDILQFDSLENNQENLQNALDTLKGSEAADKAYMCEACNLLESKLEALKPISK